MMILLKGFFRKRTTIIYSIIISTLLTSVILLFMFIKYYSILNTTYFETNSYIMIVSKYNHGGFLKTNENISNFEKGLIFEPYVFNFRILANILSKCFALNSKNTSPSSKSQLSI